jgi:hypothetical protein
MHSIPAELFGSASAAFTLYRPACLSVTNLEVPGFLVLATALLYLLLSVRQLRGAVRALEKRLESPAAPAQASPAPAQATPAPVQTPPAAKVPPQPEAIDEGILAAIAAGVAMMLKQPFRIIAVQPDAGTQHAWSSEGRRELYHSHRIR